jgi:hypothetical protein
MPEGVHTFGEEQAGEQTPPLEAVESGLVVPLGLLFVPPVLFPPVLVAQVPVKTQLSVSKQVDCEGQMVTVLAEEKLGIKNNIPKTKLNKKIDFL